jgi:hypothetical protein
LPTPAAEGSTIMWLDRSQSVDNSIGSTGFFSNGQNDIRFSTGIVVHF